MLQKKHHAKRSIYSDKQKDTRMQQNLLERFVRSVDKIELLNILFKMSYQLIKRAKSYSNKNGHENVWLYIHTSRNR